MAFPLFFFDGALSVPSIYNRIVRAGQPGIRWQNRQREEAAMARCGFGYSLAILLLAGRAATADGLPALNADPAQSSISGISSGAFMAVQFAVAWSSTLAGVGVITGGPYYCFEGNLVGFVPTGNVLPCMDGPPPDLAALTDKTDQLAAAGAIDSTDYLRKLKVYLFHGSNDKVIARSVSDAAAGYFRHYLGDAGAPNLFYQDSLAAGHSQPIRTYPPGLGLNGCTDNATPFMDQCGYDAAGVVLRHIYGALAPRQEGKLGGQMLKFDQAPYTAPFQPDTDSLAAQGWYYLPQACRDGATCRVHVALHGCEQDAGQIHRHYVDYAGYNEWADTNGIVVLYPQTAVSDFAALVAGQYNLEACWDWFAYLHHTDDYVTKSGRQIAAIKAMLDAVTHGAAAPAAAWTGAAPAGVAVIDASASALDLVWQPAPGAAGYRVERADGSAGFVPAGTVSGPSFGDGGLASATAYRYRVVALNPAGESPPSAIVTAATLALPPPCNNPGSCPLVTPFGPAQ